MPEPTQTQKLTEIIADVRAVMSTANNIERQLAVHEQRHIALDTEHGQMARLLSEHGQRLNVVERDTAQNRRDIERLVSLVEKLIWAFAAPLITALVGGAAWALSQVIK